MPAQINPVLLTLPLTPRRAYSARTVAGLSVVAVLFLLFGGGDLSSILIGCGFAVYPVQAGVDKLVRRPRQDRADAESVTGAVREYFYSAPEVDAGGVRTLVGRRQVQINDDGGGQLRIALTGRRLPTAAGTRPEAKMSFRCGDVGLADFDSLLQNAERDPHVRAATVKMRHPEPTRIHRPESGTSAA